MSAEFGEIPSSPKDEHLISRRIAGALYADPQTSVLVEVSLDQASSTVPSTQEAFKQYILNNFYKVEKESSG